MARISFWISSLLTSFLGSLRRPRPRTSCAPAPPAFDTSTFLTRTRLRFPSSLGLAAVFLRSTGSSILPTTVGPESCSALARTTSDSVVAAGFSSLCALGFAAEASSALGFSPAGSSSFLEAAVFLAAFSGFKASRSTLPTTLGPSWATASVLTSASLAGAGFSLALGDFAAGSAGASTGWVRLTTGAASLLRNWLKSISGSSSSCLAATRFLALARVMLSRSWMVAEVA